MIFFAATALSSTIPEASLGESTGSNHDEDGQEYKWAVG